MRAGHAGFTVDLLSSLPLDRVLAAWPAARSLAMYSESADRVAPISIIDILSLLRIMRVGRLMRKLSALTGANFLRVMYLMYLFTLFGHWLGLIWYIIAVRPIEATEVFDSARPWLWTLDDDGYYFVALRYAVFERRCDQF